MSPSDKAAETKSDPGLKSTDTSKAPPQKAQIARIAPQHWRHVKDDIGIYPKLDVLLVSSKGRGPGRRRLNRTDSQDLTNISKSDDGRDIVVEIPYRLAINSSTLLEHLEEIIGIQLSKDRNVWLRPFKALIAYKSEIKQALQESELSLNQAETERLPPLGEVEILSTNDTKVITDKQDGNRDKTSRNTENSVKDVNTKSDFDRESPAQVQIRRRDELRCLVDFMDNDMTDIFRRQDEVGEQAIDDIAYEHLWLLYKPGDLIFSTSSQDDDSMCQAYRVLHVTGGRHVIDPRSNNQYNAASDRGWDSESEGDNEARDAVRNFSSMTPFIIDCFFINCNGQKYGPKSRRIVIPAYKGKRSITSLDAFPAVFHPQYEAVRKALISRGRRFWDLAPGKHQYYAGPTLRESREIPSRPYYNYVIQDEEVRS